MKFALLTPYTGGNLGDAAIQEAVISNIRRRYSHAQICLITYAPGATSQLHGVPAYPIGVTTFGPGFELRKDKVPSNETNGSLFAYIKTTVKRYPVLHATLLRIYQIYQKVMVLIGFAELLHIGIAFRVMRGVSMLIVSGGGQLDDYWGGAFRQPYALLKWGLISKVLGTKFVFMSVGTCSLSKLSMLFVKRALGLADYRSYRDQTSKDLLASIEFTRGDPIYPDLAFSYVRNLYQRSAPRNNVGRVVGVSPIAYLSRYGWPETNFAAYDNYVKSLVGFVSELIRHDYTVVLFSTDPVDREVISEIVNYVSQDTTFRAYGRLLQPLTFTLENLTEQLIKFDYVVASRLHGILLSHVLGKPVLAISYDRKVDTHMTEMRMTDYCLDFRQVRTSSIVDRFKSMVSNAEVMASNLREAGTKYGAGLQNQYDHVLRVLKQ